MALAAFKFRFKVPGCCQSRSQWPVDVSWGSDTVLVVRTVPLVRWASALAISGSPIRAVVSESCELSQVASSTLSFNFKFQGDLAVTERPPELSRVPAGGRRTEPPVVKAL